MIKLEDLPNILKIPYIEPKEEKFYLHSPFKEKKFSITNKIKKIKKNLTNKFENNENLINKSNHNDFKEISIFDNIFNYKFEENIDSIEKKKFNYNITRIKKF